MNADSALYSQYNRGIYNFISDSLSCDQHTSIDQITLEFRTLLPDQVPPNFTISTLPLDIVCWIHYLGRSLTKKPELQQHPNRSKLGVLTDGGGSLQKWGLKMNGLMAVIENSEHMSCPYLQADVEVIIMVK